MVCDHRNVFSGGLTKASSKNAPSLSSLRLVSAASPNLEIHQPSFTFYIIQIISCFRTISKSSHLTIKLPDTSGLDSAAKNKNVSQNSTADRPRRNIEKRKDYHAGKKKSPGCFSCGHHKE